MRRALLLVCLLALSGCGQAASSSSEFEGAEAEVADAIEELQAAGERREGDRICKEILATELIEELESNDVACSEELEDALREADDTELEVTDVTIEGDTATAEVKGRDGQQDRVATFTLVQERGAWRVSGLG